jgi:DNA-directed RNA polymerase specialized sigma24 family protein
MAAEKEEPRLYSRGYSERTPIDEIAPQHEEVHSLLVRWGGWVAKKHGKRSLASIEGLYSKSTPPSTAPEASDSGLMDVERAVLRMPKDHRKTVVLLYVRRFTPTSICSVLHLRYEGWPAWAFACRAMVRNLLRRYG